MDICAHMVTNTHGPPHTRLDPAVRHPEEPPNSRTQKDTKIHTYPAVGRDSSYPGLRVPPGQGWCLCWVTLCQTTKGTWHRYLKCSRETPRWNIDLRWEKQTHPHFFPPQRLSLVCLGWKGLAPKSSWGNQRGFWEAQEVQRECQI